MEAKACRGVGNYNMDNAKQIYIQDESSQKTILATKKEVVS